MRSAVARKDRVFAFDVEGRAVVLFEAGSLQEARSLRKEDWFQDELRQRIVDGSALWDGTTTLVPRSATSEEQAEYVERKAKASSDDNDDLFLAFLD